jgi:ubiquinone/menaquinone biosynthesis C-methylase UbiE
MVSARLYKSSHAYDFSLRLLGFENGINRFLHGLKLDIPAGSRILDAGCGTGLLGLHFLEQIPDSTLLSTDLQSNFLQATLTKSAKRQIDPQRIQVAVADISEPHQVMFLGSKKTCTKGLENDAMADLQETSSTELEPPTKIEDGTFGLICVGAVVGYAQDTEASLRQLLRLLSPGGILLNLEMSQSLTGRLVSHRYLYQNLTHAKICDVIEEAGCRVKVQQLQMEHFPANLTRTAILATRPD